MTYEEVGLYGAVLRLRGELVRRGAVTPELDPWYRAEEWTSDGRFAGNFAAIEAAFVRDCARWGRPATTGPVTGQLPPGARIVGQNGPEIFTPDQPCVIVPADRVGVAIAMAKKPRQDGS